MNLNLSNKNIIISGATGGIGKTLVQAMNNEGANILITGTSEEKLKQFAQNLAGKVEYVVCDLSNIKNIDNILLSVKEVFENKVDVLVNNAGITSDNLALRMKEEEWHKVININLNSTFFLTKEIVKLMIKNRYGRVVNISSVVASSGNPGQTNYCASKAGIEAMSRSLALEVAKRGITINCVAPGFIETNMTENVLEKNKELILSKIPLNRLGLPADVANMVCFLCSDNSSYITGQTIHINGGMVM
jgi:3-oxoacyl-[acyl-carrier protein] reductase